MRRLAQTPRPGWQARVEADGFTFHTDGGPAGEEGGSYWNEGAAYAFTPAEADAIRDATERLHALCVYAARHVAARDELLDLFGIPPAWRPFVRASLARSDPSLYGRLDLSFDGAGPPRLLEYNADTPTTLIESAVVQWRWLADTHPGCDQFNTLHERMVARLRAISPKREGSRKPQGGFGEFAAVARAERRPGGAPVLHVSSVDDGGEDRQTARYVEDVAAQAGWEARFVAVAEVGWDARERRFVGLAGEPIRAWFKLYPWEWAAADAFGAHLPEQEDMLVLEPAWKMLLSNKALLAVLWRLFPGHPNLLAASFDEREVDGAHVAKPILSREGANVALRDGVGRTLAETAGPYGTARRVYQRAAPLFRAEGGAARRAGELDRGRRGGGDRRARGPQPDHHQREPGRAAPGRVRLGAT